MKEAGKTLSVKVKTVTTLLLLNLCFVGCATSDANSADDLTGKNTDKLKARPLGVSTIELPKINALTVKVKFDCQDPNYKIRMFKYKMRVLDNDKEIQVDGLQKVWLEKNVTIVNLKFPKDRAIKFKSLEISAHSWVRSFPDTQLSSPVALSLQQCKDLAPY